MAFSNSQQFSYHSSYSANWCTLFPKYTKKKKMQDYYFTYLAGGHYLLCSLSERSNVTYKKPSIFYSILKGQRILK